MFIAGEDRWAVYKNVAWHARVRIRMHTEVSALNLAKETIAQ